VVSGCVLMHHHISLTSYVCKGDTRPFFITAAHVLKGCRSGDYIYFEQKGGRFAAQLNGIIRDEAGFDICAFATSNLPVASGWASSTNSAIAMGQRMMFLGFPHGLLGTHPGESDYPTPLVRNAFLSGVAVIEGKEMMILDGFNNPGYSGGPVYTADIEASGDPKLCGVVSGYRNEQQSHGRIYQKNESGEEEALADLYTKPNSGMVICVHVRQLIDLGARMVAYNPVLLP